MLRARFTEININGFVRTSRKKGTYSEMQEHMETWTDATYEVVGINKSGLNGQTT